MPYWESIHLTEVVLSVFIPPCLAANMLSLPLVPLQLLWVPWVSVRIFAGTHWPLLPLPAKSQNWRYSEEVQERISYPLLQKTSPTFSSSFLGKSITSSVTMVSGLHPVKMNCSRIFNLFCLYGNVEKVCKDPLWLLEVMLIWKYIYCTIVPIIFF